MIAYTVNYGAVDETIHVSATPYVRIGYPMKTPFHKTTDILLLFLPKTCECQSMLPSGIGCTLLVYNTLISGELVNHFHEPNAPTIFYFVLRLRCSV